ncbi:MAG: N-acetylmuramoyl-L-alanine amidase [Solirubrobacterales bacterium]|nr:N-acetylmuramoyl-L-alanine amidase [Solirubrobacterales bacterium]
MVLPPSGEHAPDGGRTPVHGSEPAWTDSADVFQLRLHGHADAVRARFVRAKPTAAVARGVTGRLRRRAAAVARGAQTLAPAGAPQPPRVITRAEWGAAAVPPRATAGYGGVQLAFVHHTVTANEYTPQDSAAIVLGIARYHRDSNGWNDIGYNFLVDKYGQVFEGRAGGIGLAVIGAHAQGYNSVSTGVACLGDFRSIPESEPGIAAVTQLLAWKLGLHGVPAEGTVTVTSLGGKANLYRSGTPVTFQRISGHRDGNGTSCPGDGLYGQLPALRALVARRIAPVAASALTLRAAANRVRYPTGVRLSGQLRFVDGSASGGAPLELQFQAGGGAWRPVGAASVGGDGAWAATAELPASGLVRAVFPGDGGRPPVQATPVSVTVLPRLSLQLGARRARRGTTVKVRGVLSPAPADGRVQCVLERQVGRRWVTVQRKRVNVRRASYATALRPRVAGLYRVTVSTPGALERLRLWVT